MNASVLSLTSGRSQAALVPARVEGVGESGVLVDAGFGVVNAARAVSCLVRPAAGDRVLLSCCDDGYHVLAILDRASETGPDVNLDFPANLRLNLPAGGLGVNASRDLDLAAGGAARVVAAETRVLSREVSVDAASLTTRSRRLEAQTHSARLIADSVDTIARRISQHTGTLMRWVEGIETLNIGSRVQNIRRSWTSHSQSAVLTATGDVRIDGERIHMG